MVRLSRSEFEFLVKYHKDIVVPISFGHVELWTDAIQDEYHQWIRTEEGKKFLKEND